jgi:hypothetical protein
MRNFDSVLAENVVAVRVRSLPIQSRSMIEVDGL